ncbi:MAG: hypothetical protein Q9184_000270 [Pyrenodesmia sp. 2 TL-2023]
MAAVLRTNKHVSREIDIAAMLDMVNTTPSGHVGQFDNALSKELCYNIRLLLLTPSLNTRLQNRIAQRNHRRRLKEQSVASSDEDSSDAHEHRVSPRPSQPYNHQIPRQHQDIHEHQKSSKLPAAGFPDDLDTNFPASSVSQTMDAMMADEMAVKPDESPWQPLDPMIPPQIPGGDASNPFAFSLAQGCTCNGMTGPCARHLEEIRFQAFNAAMPTQPPRFMPTHTRNNTCTSQYEGSPNLLGLDFTAPDMPQSIPQQQPQGVLHHRPNRPSLSPKTTIPSISK